KRPVLKRPPPRPSMPCSRWRRHTSIAGWSCSSPRWTRISPARKPRRPKAAPSASPIPSPAAWACCRRARCFCSR
ncbi:MAG: hypothetical protein AVDCRST_MAG42-173, partial [uncultured Chthoniobacterales bacterium]